MHMRIVGRHLGSLSIDLVGVLVVVMRLRALQLLGVSRPIDEEGLVVLGLVFDVGRDLLDRFRLERFLSIGTERARSARRGYGNRRPCSVLDFAKFLR